MPSPTDPKPARASGAEGPTTGVYNAALMELLRKKAMLLLRREKEVFELRLERTRNEAWLRAFQKISVDLHGKTTEALLQRWVAAMIEELQFQIAAVYRGAESGGALSLVASGAPSPLPAALCLDEAAWQHVSQQQSGRERDLPDPVRDAIAAGVGLKKFVWSSLGARAAPRLLLLAGFAPLSGRFHVVNEHDLEQYRLFAAHLGALIDNVVLIGALNGERSELRASNQQLDASLHELRDTQARLVQSSKVLAEVSRSAGMAEVATGVLHNVGNALNGVNISAEVMAARLADLKLHNVGRIADLLVENGPGPRLGSYLSDDAQGRTLPAFLKRLGENLITERQAIAAEIQTLQRHVEHIKSIVNKQQAYAKTAGVTEPCLATQLVDDAFGISGAAQTQLGIEIVREYQPLDELILDKHKVLQILVNLVSNAKHAVVESGRADKRIVVRVARAPEAAASPGGGEDALATGDAPLRIEVTDNGIGIAEGHLEKMFTHGFTTRSHGHGFGLHTSALAAREMGGSLTCTSGGRGRGATFVLELPAPAAKRPAA